MLMGQIIETRTAEGARTSIESLIKLTPPKARRITPPGRRGSATSQLAVGDVIRVRPGDNVAADGVIVNGPGSFNQANITGESLPVDKKPGDEVFASTQNLTGAHRNPRDARRGGHHAGQSPRIDFGGGKNKAAHHAHH